jgi:hypothetical protein
LRRAHFESRCWSRENRVRSSAVPPKNIQAMSTETLSGSPMASANLKAPIRLVVCRLLINSLLRIRDASENRESRIFAYCRRYHGAG